MELDGIGGRIVSVFNYALQRMRAAAKSRVAAFQVGRYSPRWQHIWQVGGTAKKAEWMEGCEQS